MSSFERHGLFGIEVMNVFSTILSNITVLHSQWLDWNKGGKDSCSGNLYLIRFTI